VTSWQKKRSNVPFIGNGCKTNFESHPKIH
jgi:hypothetical protein